MKRAWIMAAALLVVPLAACGGGPSFDTNKATAWVNVNYAAYQPSKPDVVAWVALQKDGCLASGAERQGHVLALAEMDAVAKGGESMASAVERLFCHR